MNYRKTILKLIKQCMPVVLAFPLISCGPSPTNNYNTQIKTINSNVDSESKGKGGTGDGGGGQGVFCSNDTKDSRIKGKLLVRDIYEAIVNHDLTIKSLTTTKYSSDEIQPEAFKILVDSLKAYFGPASANLEFTNENFWKKFAEKISFLNEDASLEYSQDANSPISLPSTCKLVQIAFWYESSGASEEGILYVDPNGWKKLDQINKVALLAHEYFFKQARQTGYKNSDFIRSRVGQLISTKGLDTIFPGWVPSADLRVNDRLPLSMKGFRYCSGFTSEDPSAKLEFYEYQGKDDLQHFAIPVLLSNSFSLSYLQNNNFNISSMDKDLSRGSDMLLFGSTEENTEEADVDDMDITTIPSGDVAKLKLWFNNRELLGSYQNRDYAAIFNKDITGLIDSQKSSLWSANVSSASQPLQISLLNPGYNLNIQTKVSFKSKESLIVAVNNELKQRLIKQIKSKTIKNFDLNPSLIPNAISVLNLEIDKALAAGKYPERYSEWRRTINNILDTVKKRFKESDWTDFEFQDDIIQSLPHLLYQIKVNLYEKKDFLKSGLSESSYMDLPKIKLNRGKILVKQGNSSLTFELNCKSYIDLFSEITAKEESIPIDGKLNPNMEIILPENESVGQLDLNPFYDQISRVENNMFTGTVECKSVDAKKTNCADFISFFNAIKKERRLYISGCSKYSSDLSMFEPHSFNRNTTQPECSVYKFDDAKESYLMFHQMNISDSSNSETFLIRKIPFGLETDPSYVEEPSKSEDDHYE